MYVNMRIRTCFFPFGIRKKIAVSVKKENKYLVFKCILLHEIISLIYNIIIGGFSVDSINVYKYQSKENKHLEQGRIL